MDRNVWQSIFEHFNPEVVLNNSRGIRWAHLERVLKKASAILSRFNNRDLRKFANDAKLLISLIRDYVKGEYRIIPWISIAVVAFALLYVLLPMDLVCDLLPVVGWLDDAWVMYLCLQIVQADLWEYARWKKHQPAYR